MNKGALPKLCRRCLFQIFADCRKLFPGKLINFPYSAVYFIEGSKQKLVSIFCLLKTTYVRTLSHGMEINASANSEFNCCNFNVFCIAPELS